MEEDDAPEYRFVKREDVPDGTISRHLYADDGELLYCATCDGGVRELLVVWYGGTDVLPEDEDDDEPVAFMAAAKLMCGFCHALRRWE